MFANDFGTPFSAGSDAPIDAWSQSVFEACRDWPLAAAGQWYRADTGSIMLRIEAVDGAPLEPLSAIEIDTGRDHLNVDFGSWATPIAPPNICEAKAAARAAVEDARALVEAWLLGAVRIASYSDDRGWRGCKIIDGGELPAAIDPVPVELGPGGSVIVKTARRAEWRAWRQMTDGAWRACEEGPPPGGD